MAAQSIPNAHICVFGATETELRQAEDQLQSANISIAAASPPSFAFHSSSTNNENNNNNCGAFNTHRYFSSLQTTTLGRTLFTAATTSSTQSLIQENIVQLPNGVLFVADRQVGGKGRGGNVWESPDGCLMFSCALRMDISGQRLPFVQYLVTLAAVQAVQAEARTAIQQSLSLPATNINNNVPAEPLDVRIKWPNDVYSNGLKIGGILCHSSFREGKFHVIMGVGLNVANKQPTTCITDLVEAAVMAAAGGGGSPTSLPSISRESILAGVMTRLESMLTVLTESGFGPFEADYYSSWLHSGQRVNLEEENKTVGVTIRGLSPHGYLMAEDDAGEVYELHPDGNSFDFFKGLVRKKLS